MRMPRKAALQAWLVLLLATAATAWCHGVPRTVELPTRPGVTQRFLLIEAPQASAAVILFAGGDGGLRLSPDGAIGALRGNFLVRSRQLFADQGLSVLVMDAPSDRQRPPYLGGMRQGPDHAQDVRAVTAWVRQNLKLPVWLVGTSRGTQSVAAIALRHAGTADAPDGIVLTSSILSDNSNNGSRPVTAMPLEKLDIPVLVVHHEQDGCPLCRYSEVPALMQKLTRSPRKALQSYRGGADQGDPCEAMAHHGFNGLEKEVVVNIATWIRSPGQ